MQNKTLIIIVSYNGEKWIDECMSSINPDKGIDGIVIDNGSTDNTIKIIKEKYPYVKLVQPEKNLGFGKGNNVGLQYAIEKGYKYVYLLNQDAWISNDDLNNLLTVAENRPEYGIISPIHVYKNGKSIDRCFSHAIPKKLLDDILLSNNLNEIYETEINIPAAHWLLNMKVLETVGGFSPVFKHMGEDDNLTHRMFYWGYKCGIVPSSKAVHDREDRLLSTNAKNRIKGGWRYNFSNLFLNTFQRNKAFLLSFIKALHTYPYWTIKESFHLFKDLGQIKKNRILSQEKGAFLNFKRSEI